MPLSSRHTISRGPMKTLYRSSSAPCHSTIKSLPALLLVGILALYQAGCDSHTVTSPDLAGDGSVLARTSTPTPQGPSVVSCNATYSITWIDPNGYLGQYSLYTTGNLAVTSSGGSEYAPGRFYKYIDVMSTGVGTAKVCTGITGFSQDSSHCIDIDVTGTCG